MKARLLKKKFTEVIDILNQIRVVDCDFDSEAMLYLEIQDNFNNYLLLSRVCSILGIHKQRFFDYCKEEHEHDDVLDLAGGLCLLISREPKNYTIWYSSEKGFFLSRSLDEEYF